MLNFILYNKLDAFLCFLVIVTSSRDDVRDHWYRVWHLYLQDPRAIFQRYYR